MDATDYNMQHYHYSERQSEFADLSMQGSTDETNTGIYNTAKRKLGKRNLDF